MEVIELLGRKAKISEIWGAPADTFRKGDELTVYFEFDRPHENDMPVTGFAIAIPAKEYESDEFLKLVRERGEWRLTELIKESAIEKEKRQRQSEAQKRLNQLAATMKMKLNQIQRTGD